MSKTWLKSTSKFGVWWGLGLFILGGLLFVLYEGNKLEKIGIFLMTFGGVMLGMAYTAHIAWKTS